MTPTKRNLPELTPEERERMDSIDMTPILGTPSERLQFAMDKAMEYFRRARVAESQVKMLQAECVNKDKQIAELFARHNRRD